MPTYRDGTSQSQNVVGHKKMKMKRLELFEFEDFDWLPDYIRTGVTNLIKVLHSLVGTTDVLVGVITDCQEKIKFNQIIDLGSGSGGPMIDVVDKINMDSDVEKPIKLFLSDKYPNAKTVRRINDLELPNVEYLKNSVDALEMKNSPNGLKTMIASFHHMPPSIAKQILSSAEESKEPILIYELAENNISVIIWWLLLPISLIVLVVMSLIMTPFVRPLTINQIVFTYLIPVIPIVYAWDGQASIMRTYTLEDTETLIGERKNTTYTWEMCQAKNKNGKKAGYYILGYNAIDTPYNKGYDVHAS